MNRTYLIAGGLVVAILVFFATRGGDVDHEALIRDAINETIAATEAKDLPGILEHVSDRFTSGSMDKKGLKGLLFIQLRRGAWRKVFLTGADIELEAGDDPMTAQVHLAAVLATGKEVNSLEDVVPTNAGKYRFDLTFEREEGDDWRVVAAKYERVPF